MLPKLCLALPLMFSLAMAQTSMILPENSATRVSDHVYAIVGFPNIAIVIGSNATLVVDTGLGARNGAIVVREAGKLSKNPKLFLTTTHFHPEHAMGEQAFPANTIIIRPKAQQEELDQRRDEFIRMFRGFGAGKELLQDVKMRTPDIVFDREITLDLGGVSARLFWLGTAHTRGDELIFVKEDSVLISGDIVQDKIVPNMPNDDTSPKNWIVILDQLESLKPRFIVPDHGALGDGSLIAKERAILVDLQTRSLELKRKGVSADEAGKQVTEYVTTKYPGWTTMGPTANVVKRVYAESQ
ncbi:MAG TPA: MBL fold metallo-hydrolase [Bryobacteraceae bacterium]|nr:MBL fold metallo-hydrolase [Bryobacteraceae bacterium]